ncbi:MAG TPA: AraC family transcriptional regulator [Clostridiaceae bacterium]|nr:AraC family transcriptional regulator [Clostridiaceae bacterium]
MVSQVNYLESRNFFENRNVPILVMDTEHHGRVGMHSHDFYEFVYIDKGFSMHFCEGETTVLTSGDLFAIRPGQVHSYTSAHHTFLYNCLFSMEALDNTVVEDIVKLPGLKQILEPVDTKWQKLHLDFTERREVLIYLEKMKWEQINRGIGWELNMKSLLISFLVLYSRLYLSHYENISPSSKAQILHIHKALKYIEDNYEKDFLLKDMAKSINLSPDYISRQFRIAIGLSPIEYLRNFRIAKAMEKLKTTDLPISEIAKSTGFSDISNFSRQFKQVVGTSPSAFRRNYDETKT